MRSFFVESSAIKGDKIIITDKQDIHHLRDVLRMKKGDVMILSDLSETEFEARIERIAQETVELSVLDAHASTREPQAKITLYQGLPKGQKMDLVVQKSIELGASRIVPVLTKRVIPERGEQVSAKRTDRLRRIAAETVKQCQRGIVPQVEPPFTFDEMLLEFSGNRYDIILVLYELEERRSLKQALRESLPAFPASPSIAVVIGPEGGLEQNEAEALKAAGAELVTVGPTILRTETAGPAAIAMILYELEL